MLYQLIARLDKQFNFDTVCAHGEAGSQNELLLPQDGLAQASRCSTWLEDSLSLSENAYDGGIL